MHGLCACSERKTRALAMLCLTCTMISSVERIGVGRFRILGGGGGGQDSEYWGAKGGANSQQAQDVVTTSHRRHFDVVCPLGF